MGVSSASMFYKEEKEITGNSMGAGNRREKDGCGVELECQIYLILANNTAQ